MMYSRALASTYLRYQIESQNSTNHILILDIITSTLERSSPMSIHIYQFQRKPHLRLQYWTDLVHYNKLFFYYKKFIHIIYLYFFLSIFILKILTHKYRTTTHAKRWHYLLHKFFLSFSANGTISWVILHENIKVRINIYAST